MSTKIDSLTSLRFFAAFAIVLFHANQQNFPLFNGEHINQACLHGVSLFFVLSGFILTIVYFEQDLRQPQQAIAFLRKRIGRIWPLHISALIFQSVAVPSSVALLESGYLWVLIANLALVHSWIPIPNLPLYLNPPSWSVSTEWFFYLAFPLLLLGVRRSIFNPLAFACASLAMIALVSTAINLPLNSPDGVSLEAVLYKNPLARIPEFCAGMITAILYKRYLEQAKPDYLCASILEFSALTLAIALSLSSHAIARSLVTVGVAAPIANWMKVAGVPLVGCALLIAVFAMRGGALSRLLCAPLLVLLGEISYSIYLLHVPLLMCHVEYCEDLTSFSDFLIYLAILLPLSHIFYTVIERPMREFIGGTGKRHAESAPGVKPFNLLQAIFNLFQSINFRSRVFVAVELAVICLLLVAVPARISHQNLSSESNRTDRASQTACGFEVVDVPLTCKSISSKNKSGTIEFLWDASSDVRLEKYRILVLLYDKNNERITVGTAPISRFKLSLEDGQLWTSRITVAGIRRRKVARIGFMLRRDDKPSYEKLRGRFVAQDPTQVVLTRDQLRGRSSVATTNNSM